MDDNSVMQYFLRFYKSKTHSFRSARFHAELGKRTSRWPRIGRGHRCQRSGSHGDQKQQGTFADRTRTSISAFPMAASSCLRKLLREAMARRSRRARIRMVSFAIPPSSTSASAQIRDDGAAYRRRELRHGPARGCRRRIVLVSRKMSPMKRLSLGLAFAIGLAVPARANVTLTIRISRCRARARSSSACSSPGAQLVEKESNGRIKIVMPAASMAPYYRVSGRW